MTTALIFAPAASGHVNVQRIFYLTLLACPRPTATGNLFIGRVSVCSAKFSDLPPLHAAGKELILLACIHCFHDDCWTKHQKACEDKAESVHCPTCRQPVVMFE